MNENCKDMSVVGSGDCSEQYTNGNGHQGTDAETESFTGDVGATGIAGATKVAAVTVVGGIWIKELGNCAPVLGLRLREKLYFGFKAKQKFGKNPDYHIFEHDDDAKTMAEVGALWICNIQPGKPTKAGEKLLIQFGNEYLFAVRPAPIIKKTKDGGTVEKERPRKEPAFMILTTVDETQAMVAREIARLPSARDWTVNEPYRLKIMGGG